MDSRNRLKREKEYHDERFTTEKRIKSKKFYSITQDSKEYYSNLIFNFSNKKKLLEIGCAKGEFSRKILQNNVEELVGIDISEVAIEKSKSYNIDFQKKAKFLVMDGANLSFGNNSFDLVVGQSVLHHIDFPEGIQEISRVIKNNGKGIFLEPLGMNPLINFYRKLTPEERTEDERPFKKKELEFFYKYFREVNFTYFYLTAIVSVFFRNTSYFSIVKKITKRIDDFLFKSRFFQKYAWTVVIQLSKPIK